MRPYVSIIIPTFNRAHIIGETLDSVLGQTYQNWECLVIDDGSKDHTEELMEFYCSRDDRIGFYHRPKCRQPGGNAARNYGYEISKGEYIQWFDSDNIMLPEKLKKKVDILIKNIEVDFVVCENEEILQQDPLVIRKKWAITAGGDVLFNHLTGVIAFDTNGPMFRKSYLQGKKLFNEEMHIGQDWEFFSRLLIDRPRIFYLKRVLYRLRTLNDGIRADQTKEKILSKITGELELFKKIKRSQYFLETPYEEPYNKMVFYRILSRLQFIKLHFSTGKAVKYYRKAIRTVSFRFYSRGFLKSLKNPENLSNLYRIFTLK